MAGASDSIPPIARPLLNLTQSPVPGAYGFGDSDIPNSPPPSAVQISLDPAAHPLLAHHRVQNLALLPGAFCIEIALSLHRQKFGETPTVLRQIVFLRPVILALAKTALEVQTHAAQSGIEYSFYLKTTGHKEDQASPFAKLEIEFSPGAAPLPVSAQAFASEKRLIDKETFYRALAENGNHYGRPFQNLSAISLSPDMATASLQVPGDLSSSDNSSLLLDSAIQLLGAFSLDEKRTFVLRSIDRLTVPNARPPFSLQARAILHSRKIEPASLLGDVELLGEGSVSYLKLEGVTLNYLEQPASEPTPLSVCVSSTFTAEPLQESLAYWSDRFNYPLRLQFTGAGQVFQQLLDPDSAFARNRDGVNILLLSLEDWTNKVTTALTPDRAVLERCLGDQPRYTLPNGLEVAHLNQSETDYLYQEIFQNQCYLKHGIEIEEGATVLDIGANIGLFSLFVSSLGRNAHIFAFEPSIEAFARLQANSAAYDSRIQPFQIGVSRQPGDALFTSYQNSSVFSSFYPNEEQDRDAIHAISRNLLEAHTSARGQLLEEHANQLTQDRLSSTSYRCSLTSISKIIREQKLNRIHLLKIDAEKSELNIIAGIDEEHWPLIDQLVVEVHDPTRALVRQLEALLIEKGFYCSVEQEQALVHSGLFNLYARRAAPAAKQQLSATLAHNIDDLCAALTSFSALSTSPFLIALGPPSPATMADSIQQAKFEEAESRLEDYCAPHPRLRFIGSKNFFRSVPARDDYHDAVLHRLAQVSYTKAGYAAIGSVLFQALLQLNSPLLKVVVVDCDNTLWDGVCGEVGWRGVVITKGHERLHEFLVQQAAAGVLVCLCSKNNEEDVFAVLDNHPGALLRRQHLAAWQINWQEKSTNLRALARDLNLNLDSFLFLDDNPVECAEVKSECPEVLTLQLPAASDAIPPFLDAVALLAKQPASEEDPERTRKYQTERERSRFRGQQSSLAEFLAGLQLKVEIREPHPGELGRVSQLTYRTNQFNFTSFRRSEAELQHWLQSGDRTCLIAKVSDRFGDYGLVGALLFESTPESLDVDTFLLSCRALGRGVEHQLLAGLGQRARREQKKSVTLRFLPSGKNESARAFLQTCLGPAAASPKMNFPSELLAQIEYRPSTAAPNPSAVEITKSVPPLSFTRSDAVQIFADSLNDLDSLLLAIDTFHCRAPNSQTAVEPTDTLEQALTKLWQRTLHRSEIGLHENFFDAGGTSLKAVELIALIQKELKRVVPITHLFECPTIGALAAKLEAKHRMDNWATSATARGLRRRYSHTQGKAA